MIKFWIDLTKVISILNYRSRRTDMSRPRIEPGRASTVGGEHSRKEPFEQLVNSYSEYLHMSARTVENARNKMNIIRISNVQNQIIPNNFDIL
jgi:hypothetical protein